VTTAEDMQVFNLSHAMFIAVHHKLWSSWRKGPLLILDTNVQDSQNFSAPPIRVAESINQ